MSNVDTTNEFLLGLHNIVGTPTIMAELRPIFTTRQAAFRFSAWLEAMAEVLPDEDPPSTMEEIRTAVRNT